MHMCVIHFFLKSNHIGLHIHKTYTQLAEANYHSQGVAIARNSHLCQPDPATILCHYARAGFG